MIKRYFLLIVLVSTVGSKIHAQLFDRVKDGIPIVQYVNHLGAMQNRPLQDIIDSFRSQKYDEIKMSYAIYAWVAKHIRFDCKGYHHPKTANNTTTATLQNRTATSEGYANLFKTLCDVANIECYRVKGFVKQYPRDLVKFKDNNYHYWNVLVIRNMFLYIDVTLAAGETDEHKRTFFPDYSDAWFLTNKDIFQLSHFTKDPNNPIPSDLLPTKQEFLKAPVVYKSAIILDMVAAVTVKGNLKGIFNKTKALDFEWRNPEMILNSIVVVEKGEEIALPVERHEIYLSIEIPFKYTGEYPVFLKANGANVYCFMANVPKSHK